MKKFFASIWTFIVSLVVGVMNLWIFIILATVDISRGGFLGIAGIVASTIMAIVAVFIGLHFWAKKE